MQLAPPPLPILHIWAPNFVPGWAHSDAARWAGPDCWLSWNQIIQITSSPNCTSESDQQPSLSLLQCYTTQRIMERGQDLSWSRALSLILSVSLTQFPICHMWELAIPLFSILPTFRGKGDSTRAIFPLYFRPLSFSVIYSDMFLQSKWCLLDSLYFLLLSGDKVKECLLKCFEAQH